MTQSRQKKSRKFRGSRNHGWGRVSGHHKTGQKGGHGLTSGKFKHKWTMYLNQKAMGFPERQKGFPKYGNPWFIGKKGFKRPQEVSRREAYEAMNLYELDQKLINSLEISPVKKVHYKIDLIQKQISNLSKNLTRNVK